MHRTALNSQPFNPGFVCLSPTFATAAPGKPLPLHLFGLSLTLLTPAELGAVLAHTHPVHRGASHRGEGAQPPQGRLPRGAARPPAAHPRDNGPARHPCGLRGRSPHLPPARPGAAPRLSRSPRRRSPRPADARRPRCRRGAVRGPGALPPPPARAPSLSAAAAISGAAVGRFVAAPTSGPLPAGFSCLRTSFAVTPDSLH